jgi:4-hydroxy-3-polyprenylbenzoate decarboxylase
MPKRLVVGMSGASGAMLAIELLKAMQDQPDWETHLVISRGAEETIRQETSYSVAEVAALAAQVYDNRNVGANIASGTFRTEGMVIVPCSMKTVAGVASGYSENLLLRAADVTIKERRNLVLLARESPLSPIHLRNMLYLSEHGVSILPPMLTFYNRPDTIDDMVHHIIGKILNVFGIEHRHFKRWGEADHAGQPHPPVSGDLRLTVNE